MTTPTQPDFGEAEREQCPCGAERGHRDDCRQPMTMIAVADLAALRAENARLARERDVLAGEMERLIAPIEVGGGARALLADLAALREFAEKVRECDPIMARMIANALDAARASTGDGGRDA